MPLCFEVTVNDEPAIRAGLRDVTVLTAILSFVSDRNELELHVGGMVARSEDVSWLDREMRPGDVVMIRIVDSAQPDEPVTRRRSDPELDARREREYYEHLRRKYEKSF